MFWWKRNRLEGIIAASLYEPLNEKDRALLDRALAKDAPLRAEYESMQRMVNAIPTTPLTNVPDLRPLLHEKLEVAPPLPRRAPRLVFAMGTAVIVAGLAGGLWYAQTPETPAALPIARTSGDSDTLMTQALAEANSLVAKKDMLAAYDVLRKALVRQPGDAKAGEAQWLAADLAFDLKRYPEALAGYSALLSSYRDTLEKSARKEEAIERHLLLDEAEDVAFASIYAYDAALRDRTNTFAALETVIASYQGQKQFEICDKAASELALLALNDAGASSDNPANLVTAYAMARERCSSPVAAALLDLKAGDIFRDSLNDYSQAELHYQRAAENPVLAGRAKDALQRLASLKK